MTTMNTNRSAATVIKPIAVAFWDVATLRTRSSSSYICCLASASGARLRGDERARQSELDRAIARAIGRHCRAYLLFLPLNST